MSENIIYYFTGTGNSLAVAKGIQSIIKDVDLIAITRANISDIKENIKSIGIVYPIYVNAVPSVVSDFIKDYKSMFKGYIYAVATHGGREGIAGLNLISKMKTNAIKLDAYYEIEMINNTPKGLSPKIFMTLDWENKITTEFVEKMLQRNVEDIKKIAVNIINRTPYMEVEESNLSNKMKLILMRPLWKITEKSKLKVDFVLNESCTSCKKCSEICLTNRIEIISDKPQWTSDDCHCCYACFNFCPEQAIGVKHYTKKLGRYHHPNIEMNDIKKQKKEI